MTISPPDLRIRRDEDEELRAQQRAARRRLVLAITIPLLVLVLVAAGIWAVGFSSLLAVRTVAISGAKTLGNDTVDRVAAVPTGAPLARVDIDAIRQRVAGIREVESATVQRDWPHTVRIRVVERTAVYAVPQGNSSLLVDKYGVGFQSVTSASSALPRAAINPGDQKLLKPLATVVASLPISLQHRIKQIEAPTRDSIQLKLKNGDTVFWGSEDQTALKAQVVVALLKEKGSYYDVSAPGNPAVR